MVRYWFAWMPAALVVSTLVVLTSPLLALIVLAALAIAAIAGLVVLAQATASAVAGAARRLEGDRGASRAEDTTASGQIEAPRAPRNDADALVFGPYAGTP